VPIPKQAGTTLKDVEIRGEVEHVTDDACPLGSKGQGGHGELEQVDGGRIGDQNLAGSRADQMSDLVTGPGRCLVPARIPAADQVAPPFLFDNSPCVLCGSLRKPAQGVAVEVDQIGIGEGKGSAVRAQVVLLVEAPGEPRVGLEVREIEHAEPPRIRLKPRSWSLAPCEM
jgi:hypothetical protein